MRASRKSGSVGGRSRKGFVYPTSNTPSGWAKELNLISWNGGEPKYDLRQWSPDHTKMGKGISLSREEAQALMELLGKWLPK